VSDQMAPKPRAFRLDDDLYALVDSECKRLGVDFSQYVRQAVVLRIGFAIATRAAENGVEPGALDIDRIVSALERLMRNQR